MEQFAVLRDAHAIVAAALHGFDIGGKVS